MLVVVEAESVLHKWQAASCAARLVMLPTGTCRAQRQGAAADRRGQQLHRRRPWPDQPAPVRCPALMGGALTRTRTAGRTWTPPLQVCYALCLVNKAPGVCSHAVPARQAQALAELVHLNIYAYLKGPISQLAQSQPEYAFERSTCSRTVLSASKLTSKLVSAGPPPAQPPPAARPAGSRPRGAARGAARSGVSRTSGSSKSMNLGAQKLPQSRPEDTFEF